MEWTKRLKEIMHDRGINIEKLKSRIEANGNSLSRNSIGNIINGKNSPKIETLQLIAEALDIKLWELFSSEKNIISDEAIFGFVEFKGQVYRIRTRKDLKQLYENVAEIKKQNAVAHEALTDIQKTLEESARHFTPRKGIIRKSGKLSRRTLNKYQIIICDKKDILEPNDLKKDAKVWAFSSKADAKKAYEKLLKISDFNYMD